MTNMIQIDRYSRLYEGVHFLAWLVQSNAKKGIESFSFQWIESVFKGEC